MSLWPPPRLTGEGAQRLTDRYLRTLDARALQGELEAVLGCAIERLRVEPLKLKWDRFVVSVDLVDAGGRRRELIAKGYQDDRAARVARNHRLLWDAGVATSRPWGVVASLGLALSERLPGARPALDDEAGAERAARGAAALHACDAPLEPLFTVEAALDNAARHARRLAKRAPAVARDAVAIADHARAAAGIVAGAEPCPVHGDLSHASVLVAGERTFLFDWDISCRFDPAWDVGHVLAQQWRWGRQRGLDTEPVRAAFLAAYLDARGGGAGLEARVAFYEALTYLHKALTVHRTQHESLIPDLLRRADAGMAALA